MDPETEISKGSRFDSPVYPCPSFSSYSPSGLADVANRVCQEVEEEEELGREPGLASADSGERDHLERLDHSRDYGHVDDDFEFVSLVKNSNQVVGPVFPVFNRDLLILGGGSETVHGEEEEGGRSIRIPLKSLLLGGPDQPSCSSSEADELDGVPEGTCCIWNSTSAAAAAAEERSPARCKKSNSTGSCSRRWRFRDLLRRSNSEGKDSFIFLTPSSSSSPNAGGTSSKEKRTSSDVAKAAAATKAGKNKSAKEKKVPASAHETFYVRSRAMKQGDRRRSFLPYRKDLVGIFAIVNGLGRSFPPF